MTLEAERTAALEAERAAVARDRELALRKERDEVLVSPVTLPCVAPFSFRALVWAWVWLVWRPCPHNTRVAVRSDV